jgi:ABC-type uncharacterized transport system auxiliary subunit
MTARGVLVALLVVLSFSACNVLKSKPPYAVQLYMLEYAPPATEKPSIGATLRVNRFAVSQSYNSTAMLRRPEPFRVEAYHYHRWRTNPGDTVTDFMIRDLRNSGIFRAVFSYREAEETTFLIEGSVDEFLATREQDGWKVLLSLDVSLLDCRKTAITERIRFQKRYRVVEPMERESADDFARAMSGAMVRVSAIVLDDVHRALTSSDKAGF